MRTYFIRDFFKCAAFRTISVLSLQDMFPFLRREPPATPASKPRRDFLLSMFEKLLNWYYSGRAERREIRLFAELKRTAADILRTDLREDLCDPLVRTNIAPIGAAVAALVVEH